MIIKLLGIESIPYVLDLFDIYTNNIFNTYDEFHNDVDHYVLNHSDLSYIYNSLYCGKFRIYKFGLNDEFRFTSKKDISKKDLLKFDISYKIMLNNKLIKKNNNLNTCEVDIILSFK